MNTSKEHGSVNSYITGLTVCIGLTLAAYFTVQNKLFPSSSALWIILFLGFIQTIVQLVLFLHLGSEPKPHWNMTVFLFMILVVVIIVLGSMWIMQNLNYRMMDM